VVRLPDTHADLLARPLTAALTTVLADGRLQTHPVWFSAAGRHVLVNTMRGFAKERNMRADPRVTLLVVDPKPPVRWVEVRGRVTLAEEWAKEHLDELAWRYCGARRYFGEVVPAALAEREAPVIGRITPIRIVTDIDAEGATARAIERSVPGSGAPAGFMGVGGRLDAPTIAIPDSHRDLLGRPIRAVLSTRMPDGHPQTQPVWCDVEGDDVLIDTTRERRKGRNLVADPRATVLVVDPEDASRWIEIRGDVEIGTEGALEHLDRITRLYTGYPRYYGWVFPRSRMDGETRILCRIRPRHVVCDAIHR
jgi:PPOX class probable F420-dependent enzyme